MAGLLRKHGFDYWADLAKSDPGAFEAERREVIADFLSEIPAEKRKNLERLQWRIDQIRRCSSSPLGACIKISNMMMDSVAGAQGLLNLMEQLQEGELLATIPEPQPRAKVLPFVKK